MKSLLLAPHSDDEILFASWTLIAHTPDLVICREDPDRAMRGIRVSESRAALEELGYDWSHGRMSVWPAVERQYCHEMLSRRICVASEHYDLVYAPLWEEEGHHEHNEISTLATIFFGSERCRYYSTYTRTGGRTQGRSEVPYDPTWIARKLRALACFETQHVHPQRSPWFVDLIDLREWYG